MRTPTAFLFGAACALALFALGGLAVVYGGFVGVSALESHSGPVASLLETARDRGIHARLDGIEVPPLSGAEARRGEPLYRRHCLACHGAPGVPIEPFARGMNPVPPELAHHDFSSDHEAAEAYWVIANGIRMTGMPGFALELDDDELWAVVAYLRILPGAAPPAAAGDPVESAAP